MFIMVHDLELSVGGQVYLGETRVLTTSLQRCSEDRVDEISIVLLSDLLSVIVLTFPIVCIYDTQGRRQRRGSTHWDMLLCADYL